MKGDGGVREERNRLDVLVSLGKELVDRTRDGTSRKERSDFMTRTSVDHR